jgi:hypothetical protein
MKLSGNNDRNRKSRKPDKDVMSEDTQVIKDVSADDMPHRKTPEERAHIDAII